MEGIILKMEFLHTPVDDQDHLVLLLVISTRNKTKIRCYEWDRSQGISEEPKLKNQPLHDDQQLPLLLIPLTMETSFMLVFENLLVTYTEMLTGPATAYRHELGHFEDAEEPGSSRAKPVFTQWARTMRRGDHVSAQDNIYLCREDGVVRFLEISAGFESMIDSSHEAGRLKINANTAFASIHVAGQCADYLMAGGDQSDGGLWKFAPRGRLTSMMDTIRNWTPTIDLAAAHVLPAQTGTPRGSGAVDCQPGNQKQLFTCTGRNSVHGALTELRRGIEASIQLEGYKAGQGVNRMWALNDHLGNGIRILLSYSTHTDTFLTGSEIKSESSEDDLMLDADEDGQLNLEAETLAAGTTGDGFIIQITPKTIRAIRTSDGQKGLAFGLDETQRIYKASVLRSAQGALLLVAVAKGRSAVMRIISIFTDKPEVRMQDMCWPWLLNGEPSLVSLQEMHGKLIALVGTLRGSLEIIAQNGTSLAKVAEHSFSGQFAICHSLATVEGQAENERIVCGLRNGTIQTLLLERADESDWKLRPLSECAVGNTPVSLIADLWQPYRVIAACRANFCVLEYGPSIQPAPNFERIWITNQRVPAYCQGEIAALCQINTLSLDDSSDPAAEQIFCVDGEEFRVVDMGRAPRVQMVPRHIHVDGTPFRVIYSKVLSKLIVLYGKARTKRPPQGTSKDYRTGQRAFHQVLAFLEPNEPFPSSESAAAVELQTREPETKNPNTLLVPEVEKGEKILGLLEWSPKYSTSPGNILIIHTKIEYADNRAPTGRLLLYSLALDAEHRVVMSQKKPKKLKAPVYAVASYGTSSIVYSCGNDIHLQTLELVSDRVRWESPVVFALRSRGTHISVNEPFVYVSTASESLMVLKVTGSDGGEANGKLVFQYGDEVAREGLYHLELMEQGLVLAASKDSTITGLWMPPKQAVSNALSTVFTVALPGSITRVRRMERREQRAAIRGAQNLPEGRLTNPIVGCTTDGSLYQMDILNEPSWRLLRFIVNMAKRHPVICPFRDIYMSPHQERSRSHINPSPENKRHRHIDGDILMRVLERGGENILSEVLEREPGDDRLVVDFESANARQERFLELLEDVGFAPDIAELEPLMHWIRRLVEPCI